MRNNSDPVLSGLQRELEDLFAQALREEVFPGAVIGIAFGPPERRKKTICPFGRVGGNKGGPSMAADTVFDLASLTKPFATTLAVLCLLEEKKMSLDTTLASLFEKEVAADKENITVKQLLGHTSGLPDHRPYFEKLIIVDKEQRRDLLVSLVMREPLVYQPGSASCYSDLGFMILGWIIERVSGTRLDVFVKKKVMEPLGLQQGLLFKPLDAKHMKERVIAPTEQCPWRGKLLRGKVHDDNAYAIGGVAGQAGLFGDTGSVLAMASHLLDQWQGRESHPFYDSRALREAARRQTEIANTTWGLGFDTPSAENSSGGNHLSASSFGHLGYTGTSFWIDPVKDLVMVLLTNRVHPDRNNLKIKTFRPLFHDTVIKSLGLA